jgi:bidirectional [NiFe] hydrogenase diaphorase subunit
MSETVRLTINGQEIDAAVGSTILIAARKADIHIPNLCHNDELKPYGSCRLCLVEISHANKTRLVASCIYEVADGLTVETETPKVNNVRRLVIELLLARSPTSQTLLKIASALAVRKSRFETDLKGCILCGLCVRVCREIVGTSAIGYKGRGFTREVATPFDESPPDCIACGACAWICPTDHITVDAEKLESFRSLPGKDRLCRYSLMGLLEGAICANSFRCWKCEVEQQFVEQLDTHPIFLRQTQEVK